MIIAIGIGLMVLQVFLSKMENKKIGLILPGFYFFITLLSFLLARSPLNMGKSSSFSSQVFSFLSLNSISLVLLAIYFFLRRNKKS